MTDFDTGVLKNQGFQITYSFPISAYIFCLFQAKQAKSSHDVENLGVNGDNYDHKLHPKFQLKLRESEYCAKIRWGF